MIMIVIMIVTDDDDPSASLPRSPPSDLTRGLGGSSKNTWTPLTRILVCNLIIQCPVWSAPKENRRHSSVEGIKIIREPPPPPPHCCYTPSNLRWEAAHFYLFERKWSVLTRVAPSSFCCLVSIDCCVLLKLSPSVWDEMKASLLAFASSSSRRRQEDEIVVRVLDKLALAQTQTNFSPLTTKYCNMYHSCGFICVWFPIKYRKTEEEKTEHWKVFGGFLLLHRQVGAPLVHQTPFLCRQISRKKKDWIYLPLPGSDCTGLHKISTIVEPLSAPTGAFYVTKPFLKFQSTQSYSVQVLHIFPEPGHDFKVLALRACLTSSFVPLSLRPFDPHKGDNS